jgi:hypothetical protein
MAIPGLKDLTPAQASRWVAQEEAKHTDLRSIEYRINAEKNFLRFGITDYPNSLGAHKKLIELLEAKKEALS